MKIIRNHLLDIENICDHFRYIKLSPVFYASLSRSHYNTENMSAVEFYIITLNVCSIIFLTSCGYTWKGIRIINAVADVKEGIK